ncbi:MAG: tetratricopeptide repeat protein [Flavobacteriaceae bacterium]|nr:tetratricopeptide repeat protein [Flavobacteriaceae bacterium]
MDDELLNNELIDKFEDMLELNEHYYFDGEELNEIISYYLDIGDLPFAYKAIEYALQLHPESVAMRIKVLEYMIEVNMLHDAADLIEELKTIADSDIDFIVAQARFWSLKGMHKRAVKFYLRALDYDIENEYIHHCLGAEYLEIDNIGQALYHYKQALEMDLDDEMALYACVQCFDEIHRQKDCINFLLQYIDMRPYSESAWYQLGLQYLKLKQTEKALEAFEYAVCTHPKSINNHMKVAHCQEILKRYDDAVQTYLEVLEIDDSPGFTLMKIAECYVKKQENSKAISYLHLAIHEDPQLDKAWAKISEIYESIGNLEEAVHYLKRAVDLDSMDVKYHRRLAFLYIASGKYEEAEKCFSKIVKIEPNKFLNWLGYTELLIVLGEYENAINIAEKGLKRFEKAELYYQISCCEYLLNDNKKGLATFLRAKKLNPKILSEMYSKYPILKLKTNISLQEPEKK